MIILQPNNVHHNYELIDSGNGERLEQFGSRLIVRTDSTCLWRPQDPKHWNAATVRCSREEQGRFSWKDTTKSSTPWSYSYHNPALTKLSFSLRTSDNSKNIGIFPEQAAHWDWLVESIKPQASVLNLFAYTGGATIVAAARGASVCHVDASKSAITWARSNAEANQLASAPIRWIVEDCLTFMQREIKRGVTYDGIIMDPPAFGRDPRGNRLTIEQTIHPLLAAAKALLTKDGFLLMNIYSIPLYATHIGNVVREYFPDKKITVGELHLAAKAGNAVPCNIFARVA